MMLSWGQFLSLRCLDDDVSGFLLSQGQQGLARPEPAQHTCRRSGASVLVTGWQSFLGYTNWVMMCDGGTEAWSPAQGTPDRKSTRLNSSHT